MPFVPTADGAELYYRQLGWGPIKILFLMGMYGRHCDFWFQLEWFGEFKRDRYTVVALDHRGAGFSLEPGQGLEPGQQELQEPARASSSRSTPLRLFTIDTLAEDAYYTSPFARSTFVTHDILSSHHIDIGSSSGGTLEVSQCSLQYVAYAVWSGRCGRVVTLLI